MEATSWINIQDILKVPRFTSDTEWREDKVRSEAGAAGYGNLEKEKPKGWRKG